MCAVLVCAFTTGFMWRVRGDTGFGSMWGMFVVLTALSLFVFSVFGDRKKGLYGMLPAAVLAGAVTVGGWGTLNRQMSGVGIMEFHTAAGGGTVYTPVSISPVSGLVIMLLLGFGWMPFFAFLMGHFFSDRAYRPRDFVLAAVLFYLVQYLCKATAAHPLLYLINPQAVELFGAGLSRQGMDAPPFLMYLRHFDSSGWAKTVEGGRNYFTSVGVISNAFGAAAVCLYQRFALRDRPGGRTAFFVNLTMALSITLADLFLVVDVPGGVFHSLRVPKWITDNDWPLWEYSTGFLLGLGLMSLFFAADRRPAGKRDAADALPKMPAKAGFVFHSAATLTFTLGFTLIRPLVDRLSRQQFTVTGKRIYYGAADYGAALAAGADPASVVLAAGKAPPAAAGYALLCAAALAISMAVAGRNILKKKLGTPVSGSFAAFCSKAFVLYSAAAAAIYFLTGSAYAFEPQKTAVTLLMLFSLLVMAAGAGAMRLIGRKNARGKQAGQDG